MSSGFLAALVIAATASVGMPAEQPAVVYRWDASAWLASYNHSQFSAQPVTNPDGSVGAQITVTPRSAANPYNMVIGTSASLKGGNQYTAAITFSVAEPTKFPSSFYMFARNSAGNQYDIWQTWTGLPGPTRTITLPLELRSIDGGNWKLYMGISNSGALNIHSIAVYSGLTSDGTTPFTTVEPVLNGTPASLPQAGISAATGYTPFAIAPPEAPKSVISLADYKFTPDSAGAPASIAVANAVALQQAINACKSPGAVKLLIPKGTYRIAPVSNIAITGLNDLTVEGQGAVLILETMTKEGPAFSISNCNRLLIENLNLDWDWSAKPIASLGTVSNLSADKLQCDFTFPDLDAAQTALTRTTPWRGIFGMDPVRLVKQDVNNFVPPKETIITAGSADNVLHVTFPKPAPLVNGATYCIRHLYYEMGGFKVGNSSDVTFRDVNIYSMPGMGWFFAGAMHNFELRNCSILRRPGSRTPLTTAADGIHVDQFIDNLNIENCFITGTGDDAMNIHSESYQGTIVPDEADPKKLTLLNCPSWQLRLNPGDPIEFYNADFSFLTKAGTPTTRQVAKASSVNSGKPQTIVELTEPLPAGVTSQSILVNGRYLASNVRISGCRMVDVSGRGILLSAKNVLMEDCHFENVYSSSINLESEIFQPLWTEGRGASNVLIRKCLFENGNSQGRYSGAIIHTNTRIPWGPTATTLYEQITIENNRFVNCPGPVVSLSNASNVLVRSNEILLTRPIANPSRYAGTLFLTKSSDAALGGNKWMNGIAGASAGGVVFDPATTSGIFPDTNAVKNLEPVAPAQ